MEINLKASNLPISPYAVLFMGLRDQRFPTQLTTTDVIIKIVFLSFLKKLRRKEGTWFGYYALHWEYSLQSPTFSSIIQKKSTKCLCTPHNFFKLWNPSSSIWLLLLISCQTCHIYTLSFIHVWIGVWGG